MANTVRITNKHNPDYNKIITVEEIHGCSYGGHWTLFKDVSSDKVYSKFDISKEDLEIFNETGIF